jgi:hypothetical protein
MLRSVIQQASALGTSAVQMGGSCRQRRPILAGRGPAPMPGRGRVGTSPLPAAPTAKPGLCLAAGRADQPLEVLAGIICRAVAASVGRGAPWPRLVQSRIRVAAVPPAEGNAMVGEFFPELGQGPVPQLDPAAGAQRLLADGLPVYPARGHRPD